MSAPVMIMAGGTGGHIFPALAVAQQLKRRSIPVVWLGSRGGMETRLVPLHDIPVVEISVSGLRGKGVMALLLAPFKLSLAVLQALYAQFTHKPRAVLGMGGFVAGPGGLAAWLLRRPLFIHEQNAIPGLTNRLLSLLSRCVMSGFPGVFPQGAHVGNPVREDIVQLATTRQRLADREGAIRIFVFGGSLGALSLNEQVPKAIAALDCPVEIRHQTGERHEQFTLGVYEALGLNVALETFIDNMADAYSWADLVIARAGALTVTEIAQVGVASILVPYPYAVDDHQTANAAHLESIGAARIVDDNAVKEGALYGVLQGLTAQREVLIEMGEKAHALARPYAADLVASICLGEVECHQQFSKEGGAQ